MKFHILACSLLLISASAFSQDAEKQAQLMERCFESDVNRLFLPNVDVNSIAMIDDLVAKYPANCLLMMA